MNDTQNLINIFETGFIICLAFCILFFIISVVLFFVFDIKTIFSIRTGRAQKKKIGEMTQQNELTGRLISGSSSKSAPSMSFSTKLNKIKKNIGEKPPQQVFDPQRDLRNIEPQQPFQSAPSEAPPADIGSDQTTLLDVGSDQTTLLDRRDNNAAAESETKRQPVKITPSVSAPAAEKALNQQVTAEPSAPVSFEIGEGETMQLSADMIEAPKRAKLGKFNIVKDIMLIHTDETIG